MERLSDRLTIAENGIVRAIGPDEAERRARQEALVRDDYDRCHPDDSFDDLMRRARFSKEDQGLLRDWMALAAQRELLLEQERIDMPHGRLAA